jgi:signal transduction histidine kinase
MLLELKERTQGAVADIRRLVYGLRPPALDELGLSGAVRQHAAAIDGVQVVVDAPDDLAPLPAAVEVAAYRIIQEALTNVVRHAAAQRCTIRLTRDDALCLEVLDDGRGLPAHYRAGVGLLAMRERAAELGGQCVIAPRAGGGTRVWAALPLDPPAAARTGERM